MGFVIDDIGWMAIIGKRHSDDRHGFGLKQRL
jgi:hypothetical protein